MVINGLDMLVVVCHGEHVDQTVATSTAHELKACD